jgi:hypothetical protein
MQQTFDISSQLANCCCENRLATANLGATIASEACATRANDTQNTQSLLNTINGGIQSIKDQLCQDKIDAKNDEIAQLEGIQFQIAQFKKTLIEEVEGRINGMFSYVRFKMYEQQINGGERETCEALIDGVPYSTNVNTASRVNAGLDVINAICKSYDVYAPIFVDNRESVTKLIPTESQIVNLFKDSNYTFLTKI